MQNRWHFQNQHTELTKDRKCDEETQRKKLNSTSNISSIKRDKRNWQWQNLKRKWLNIFLN